MVATALGFSLAHNMSFAHQVRLGVLLNNDFPELCMGLALDAGKEAEEPQTSVLKPRTSLCLRTLWFDSILQSWAGN